MAESPFFCIHCGAQQLNASARFCQQCGQPLVPPQTAPATGRSPTPAVLAPVDAPASPPRALTPAAQVSSATAGVTVTARRRSRWPVIAAVAGVLVIIALAAFFLTRENFPARPTKEVMLERSVKAMSEASSYHYVSDMILTAGNDKTPYHEEGDYEAPGLARWTNEVSGDTGEREILVDRSRGYMSTPGKGWEVVPTLVFTDSVPGQVQGDAAVLPRAYKELIELEDETVDGVPCYHLRFTVDLARYARIIDPNSTGPSPLESMDGDLWISKRNARWVRFQEALDVSQDGTRGHVESTRLFSDYDKSPKLADRIKTAREAISESLYTKAAEALAQGSLSQAISGFKQVLEVAPGYKDAAAKLSEAIGKTDPVAPVKARYEEASQYNLLDYNSRQLLQDMGFGNDRGWYYPDVANMTFYVASRNDQTAQVEARGVANCVPISCSGSMPISQTWQVTLGSDGAWQIAR